MIGAGYEELQEGRLEAARGREEWLYPVGPHRLM